MIIPRRLHRPLAALAAGAGVLALAAVAAPPAAAANPSGPGDPMGAVFGVAAAGPTALHAVGWAADPDAPTANATVLGLVDGRAVSSVVTDVARPRVAARRHTGATPGFDLAIPVPSGSHVACVAVANQLRGTSRILTCVTVPLGTRLDPGTLAQHSPQGALAGATATATAVRVTGWTREPDFLARRSTVVVYVDGAPAATRLTGRSTAVERTAGAARRGAFDVTVAVSFGSHLACVWVVNVGYGTNTALGCAAADTRGPAGTGTVSVPRANRIAAKEAMTHVGQPYVWAAAGPAAFDCSGLVVYSYRKAGVSTPRIANDQFFAARVVPQSRAVRGDLVFWHDATGAVYHVSIFLGGTDTVAAVDPSSGVRHQNLWDQSILSYGSFTHA